VKAFFKELLIGLGVAVVVETVLVTWLIPALPRTSDPALMSFINTWFYAEPERAVWFLIGLIFLIRRTYRLLRRAERLPSDRSLMLFTRLLATIWTVLMSIVFLTVVANPSSYGVWLWASVLLLTATGQIVWSIWSRGGKKRYKKWSATICNSIWILVPLLSTGGTLGTRLTTLLLLSFNYLAIWEGVIAVGDTTAVGSEPEVSRESPQIEEESKKSGTEPVVGSAGAIHDKPVQIIRLRAECVCEYILAHTLVVRDLMLDKITSIRELNRSEKQEVSFVLQCVLLCQAQKTFWESIIENDDEAEEFEKRLFEYYTERTEADPRPTIAKYIQAIETKDPQYEIRYVAMRICRDLDIEGAASEYALTLIYLGSLETFYGGLKAIAELPETKMREMMSKDA